MADKEVMLVVLNELISIRKNCSSLLNKIEEQRETLEAALEIALAQPEKKWVWLTEEDIAKNIYAEGEFMLPYSFASSIQVMLKDKNGF